MKWKMGHVVFLPMVVVLSACPAAAPKPPVHAKLPVPALRMHDKAELTREGLKVLVTPIAADNLRTFPQIWRKVALRMAVQNPQGGAPIMVNKQVGIPIVPLPAFQVRIANNTGHVVRLSTAVFRLQNNVGKRFQTFASTHELLAWNMGYIAATVRDLTVQAQLGTQIQSALNSLQLLGRSVELLKGDEWTGYLVFNMQTTKPQDYMDLMGGTERFTLRLAEIPIEIDAAGKVSKTTEFTFVLDKTSVNVAAICPPETKQPSWQVGCRIPE